MCVCAANLYDDGRGEREREGRKRKTIELFDGGGDCYKTLIVLLGFNAKSHCVCVYCVASTL